MEKAYNLDNLEALFNSYLSAENKSLSSTSIKNYLSDFRHFLGWLKSNQEDSEVDRSISAIINESTLLSYLRYLDSLNLPLKTHSRRLSTLRKFLQFGEDKGLKLFISSSILSQTKNTSAKNTGYSETNESTLFVANHIKNKNLITSKTVLKFGSIFALIVTLVYIPSKLTSLLKTKPNTSEVVTRSSIKSGRIFAFQGKLTDSQGNNITSLTSIQFKLYDSPSSTHAVYQTGNCKITPDRNGYFSVLIGGASMSPPPLQDTCGKAVGTEIFSNNSNIYLGTTVATDNEMTPRKQIANVGYAMNSETLKGLPLGSTQSSIPFISSDGSVVLSLSSPSITSTFNSGTFSIKSASDLSLQTGRDGDLSLNATGSGSIKLRTGNSTVNRIYISEEGNVGISTSTPNYFRLEVSGDVGPELSSVYDVGSPTRIWNDVYTDRLCFDGSSDCISNSQGIFSALGNSTNSQLVIKDSLVSGNSVSSGTTTLDIAGGTTSYALCHSTQSGVDNEKIVDCSSTPTADFAEMYPVETGSEFGDIMTLGPKIVKTTKNENIRQLIKASKQYDGHVIGIISDNYDDFISVGHNIASSENPMPIALKGRVPVKISSYSDAIEAGDYITTSTEAGKGIKSTGDGVVIGRALESWEPGSIKNQIMVFVGIDYVVQTKNPIVAFTENLTTAISAKFDEIRAQRVISPVIQTSEIRPELGSDLSIDLGDEESVASKSSDLSKLVIKGIKKAVVASIDAEGNILSKGTIKAEDGIFNNSLTAGTIKSRTTDDLSANLNEVQSKLTKLSESTYAIPASPPVSDSILSSISHDLLTSRLVVTERAELNELSVQNKISSRSDTLELIANSSISFFDGSATLSKDGDLVTKGKITAKELELKNIDGITVASISASGSAKLSSISLPKSSGSAIIPEGDNEVKVYSSNLSESSLIYITPETEFTTLDKPLVVKSRKLCESSSQDCENYFSVAMSTNNHPDLKFNWLIIN